MPFSYLFMFVAELRRLAYRCKILKSYRLPVPVVVVGNITVGGTGKTPFVIWLVKLLQKHGVKVGVISRGYGAAEQVQLLTAQSTAQQVGDEPLLIFHKTNCPVAVGANRYQAGCRLLQEHDCEIIVSDDGLQHYALQRDFEIALLDGQRRIGNGLRLPAGPLREGVGRLAKVDALVVTSGDVHEVSMQLQPGPLRNMKTGEIANLQTFAGKKIHAVAGIANPDRFFTTLKELELNFAEHAFPDHHFYSKEDLAFANDSIVLMTEKDAVKCTQFAESNWYCLPVEAKLPGEFALKLMDKLIRE
jgi:tetraacyldisaccharide 4'-kinase